jgi:hypothetical protein
MLHGTMVVCHLGYSDLSKPYQSTHARKRLAVQAQNLHEKLHERKKQFELEAGDHPDLRISFPFGLAFYTSSRLLFPSLSASCDVYRALCLPLRRDFEQIVPLLRCKQSRMLDRVADRR